MYIYWSSGQILLKRCQNMAIVTLVKQNQLNYHKHENKVNYTPNTCLNRRRERDGNCTLIYQDYMLYTKQEYLINQKHQEICLKWQGWSKRLMCYIIWLFTTIPDIQTLLYYFGNSVYIQCNQFERENSSDQNLQI